MDLLQTLPLFILIATTKGESSNNMSLYCEHYKHGPNLDVRDLVGIWMTVYTQPKAVSCFTLSIRGTTDLEREQLAMRYGNFSDRVDWDTCFLQVESSHGKHFLQGDGTYAGLQNIVIDEDEKGRFGLQDQNADQWFMYGRRGGELLLMRDCSGEALAIFARAPYWPATTDLYAILHRSGIKPMARQRVICEPLNECHLNSHVARERTKKKGGW